MTQFSKKISTGLIGKNGNLLTNEKDILSRWEEYVENWYTGNGGEEESWKSTSAQNLITIEVVESIIRKLPKKKCPGPDEIPAEFLQRLGQRGIEIMT